MKTLIENETFSIKESDDKYHIKVKVSPSEERVTIEAHDENSSQKYDLPKGESTIRKEEFQNKSVFIGIGDLPYKKVIKESRSQNIVKIKIPDFMDSTYFHSIESNDTEEFYDFEDDSDEIQVYFENNFICIEGLMKGAKYTINGKYREEIEPLSTNSLGDLFDTTNKSSRKFTINNIKSCIDTFDISCMGEELNIKKPEKCDGKVSISTPIHPNLTHRCEDGNSELNLEIPKVQSIDYEPTRSKDTKPEVTFKPNGMHDKKCTKRGTEIDFTDELPKDNKLMVKFPSWANFDIIENGRGIGCSLDEKGPNYVKIKPEGDQPFKPLSYINNCIKFKRFDVEKVSNLVSDEDELNIRLLELNIYIKENWEDVRISIYSKEDDEVNRTYMCGDSGEIMIVFGPTDDKCIIEGKEKYEEINLSDEDIKYTRSIVV